VVLANHHSIQPKDLDLPNPEVSGERMKLSANGNGRRVIEKQKVIDTLELCRHNISKAARMLGVSRPTVYSFKRKYGV
jgi:transcriptional regulator of acetoin/glycerol metabolism